MPALLGKETFTSHGLTCEIRECDIITHNFWNGYILLPKSHPLYGVDYDKASKLVGVHWGFTYGQHEGDFYVLGFDTVHAGDVWPTRSRDEVSDEMKRLLDDMPHRFPSFLNEMGGKRWTKELVKDETICAAAQLACITHEMVAEALRERVKYSVELFFARHPEHNSNRTHLVDYLFDGSGYWTKERTTTANKRYRITVEEVQDEA
jgi:hypothetical protein